MPPIPVVNPLGYVGVFLIIAGFFLTVAGLDLIKVEKLTITPGRKTWGIGLLLAAIGILFLWPDISSAITSSAVPTSTFVVAPNITSPSPTPASTIAIVVQPTSVNNIATAETLTSIPVTLGAPTATSQAVACVTSQKGSGVPAEVEADSFIFSSYTGGSPGPKLPLANGQEILFSNMKSFEVISVTESPYRLTVTITLLNGDTITDDVPVYNEFDAHLEGIAKYGPFSILLSDVKRVEFQQGGCQ